MLHISSLWMWTAHERRCDFGVKLLSKGLTAKSCFLSAFPAARKINPSFLKGDLHVCHAELISRTLVRLSRRLPRDKASLAAKLPSNFSKPAISQWCGQSTRPSQCPSSLTAAQTFTPLGEKEKLLSHPSKGISHLQVSQDPLDSFQSLSFPFCLWRLRG